MSPAPSRISESDFAAFLASVFSPDDRDHPTIVSLADGHAVMSLRADDSHMRPGQMVSGPTQMSLVDTAAYACVMTRAGLTPMAVTSSLDIHFLRPCIGPMVRVEARLLRFGRRRAVMDVKVYGEGHADPAATALVAYAMPQDQ